MNSADPSWELIASGDLFSSEQLTELQADYIRVPPGQKTVIEWLLENKSITDYHVKVLQAGHSGPFRYGDYLVQDRISGGAFDGGFKSVHVPSRHPVLLDFVNGEQTESQWNEVRKRAYDSRFFASPFLLRCHEAVEVDDFKFLVFEDFNATPLPSILAKKRTLKPPSRLRRDPPYLQSNASDSSGGIRTWSHLLRQRSSRKWQTHQNCL